MQAEETRDEKIARYLRIALEARRCGDGKKARRYSSKAIRLMEAKR